MAVCFNIDKYIEIVSSRTQRRIRKGNIIHSPGLMHNDYRHYALLLAARSLILLSLETLPCHILKVQPSILILYTFFAMHDY